MPICEDTMPVKDLDSLLRQTLGDDITIDKVDWKHLTNPGENFGSLILAVNATVTSKSSKKNLNLVVKLPPPSTWLQELFNSPKTFVKELQFYRHITPQFLSLKRESSTKKNDEITWLGADYYGGRLGITNDETFDDQASIVLQNLNACGYSTTDRLRGLSKDQCEYAVKKLAELHATAIAMREKKPKFFEEYVLPGLEQCGSETAYNCMIEMIEKSLKDLKDIPEAAIYLKSVKKTIDHGLEAAKNNVEPTKKHWATLVHNDFWVNNMMFKTDETGKIVDMKIVDFQLTVYDYGLKDLIFFLVSSPAREVIDDNFDRLTDLYYEGFVESLESFGIDVQRFPKTEFIEILNECGPVKFDQCLMMIQVIKSKPGSAPKMEDIESSENFLTIGGGEVYQRKMLHTVEFFHKRGWLKT